jgi:hypothetical protein
MASKITYLLGAGASANALPLIKSNPTNGKLGLPEQLKGFAENYRGSSFSTSDMANRLIAIAEKCIQFGTPDLYAKYLLEIGDRGQYELLKKLLANYFYERQALPFTNSGQGCFDHRALSFLTTIAQNEKLPPNVGALSWNYDNQIEIAAQKLKPINSQVHNRIKGFTCWPNFQDSYNFDERIPYSFKEIFLLHLNGVAGYSYSERTFSEKTNAVYNFENAGNTMLSFAWEDDSNDNKRIFIEQRIEYARRIAEGTEILVVVGYSFPFFNRRVDDMLIDAMRSTLTKIYYQDPCLDGSQLATQFNLTGEAAVKIEHVSRIDNYHIPYEL